MAFFRDVTRLKMGLERDSRGIRFVSEERDTNCRDIRENVEKVCGWRISWNFGVEKYGRDMATTGRCGQVIDVTGAHGWIETKVGQLKLKSETKEFFSFFLS